MKLLLSILITFETVAYVISATAFNQGASEGCGLSQNGDLSLQQPLFIIRNRKWELYRPESKVMNFPSNVVLGCTPASNTFGVTTNKTNILYAKCNNAKQFLIGSKTFDISELSCKRTNTGDVISTKTNCGNNLGKLTRVGFDLSQTQFGFIDLYQVCYNQNSGSVIYSQHTLYGKSIAHNQNEMSRPTFKSIGTAMGVSPSKVYKRVAQSSTFDNLVGEDNSAKYISNTSFLSRGHLAPDGDFILYPEQAATYFYVNTCPQWQVINQGNWLKVEQLTRKIADRRQEDILILTGVHDVLELKGEDGKNKKIYLEKDEKLEVPKWTWKIIYSNSTQEAIAFVTLNNPFVERVNKYELICANIIDKTDFNNEKFENVKKGFTYGCSVPDLRKTVRAIPNIRVSKLLSTFS